MSNNGSVTKESAAAVCTPNIDCYVDDPGSSIQGNTADNEVARIVCGKMLSESVKPKNC